MYSATLGPGTLLMATLASGGMALASLLRPHRLANNLPPIANVAISNVPGPKVALYMAGAKMLTYYPVSIVTHSLGLNVTVQSYNGNLDWGLIACRKAMPDLPELAKYMMAAHRELMKLSPVVTVVEKVEKVEKITASVAETAATAARAKTNAVSAKRAVPKAAASGTKRAPASKHVSAAKPAGRVKKRRNLNVH